MQVNRVSIFDSLMTKPNARLLTRQFYEKTSKNQKARMLLSAVMNRISGLWLEVIVRFSGCNQFDCAFNLTQTNSAQEFTCKHQNVKIDYQNLFVDARLTNLITKQRSDPRVAGLNPDRLYDKTEVMVKQSNEVLLIVSLNQRFEIGELPQGQVDKYSIQDKDSTKKELDWTLERYSKSIFEHKAITGGQITEIIKEINEITAELKIDILCKNIIELSSNIRQLNTKPQTARPEGLFTINSGIMLTNANENRQIVEIELKADYRIFYLMNAGAFMYRADNSISYLVVAGNLNVTDDYNKYNIQPVGQISEFIHKSPTELTYRCRLRHDLLKLSFPATAFDRQNGIIYIAGGLSQDMVPSNKILEYNVRNNTLSVVAEMDIQKFNHSATFYKKRLYIAGGVKWNEYKKRFNGRTRVEPFETISNFDESLVNLDVEIYEKGMNRTTIIKQGTSDVPKFMVSARSVCLVMPYKHSEVLILCAGNWGFVKGQIGQAVATDINNKNLSWFAFGENNLKLDHILGHDTAISQNSFIIDTEGYQQENSATYMATDNLGRKSLIFMLTSKGAERSYRWI